MKRKIEKILFVGYGIGTTRAEAVNKNCNTLAKTLNKRGVVTYFFGLSLNKNFLIHLLRRRRYISEVSKIIEKNNVTIIQDVFVLPFSSLVFTFPLISKYPHVKFIKEIHNDAGINTSLHLETFIRLLLNSKWQLNMVLKRFHKCFSRSLYLSRKYKIKYFPHIIKVYKSAKRRNDDKIIRICYLGHPLKKKGVDLFPRLLKIIPDHLKSNIVFNFAFSNLGIKKYYVNRIKKIGNARKIKVNFYSIVKPEVFFRENDIFVLPLTDEYSATSLPNTILESIEAGCVVITTKTNITDAVLRDKFNALLADKTNESEILEKITLLIDNRNIRNGLSKNARDYLIKTHSSEKIDKAIKVIYE